MLQPLKDKVLIDPEGKKTETESGLYTGAYSVEGSLRRGTVLAIGDRVREVKVGDKVAYEVFVGSIIKRDGKEYALIHEAEIIGIINE